MDIYIIKKLTFRFVVKIHGQPSRQIETSWEKNQKWFLLKSIRGKKKEIKSYSKWNMTD